MEVIGVREEKYIGTNVEEEANLEFKYYKEEMTRHIICGLLPNNKKVEITLEDEYGECGSGWSVASWGKLNYKVVNKFNGYNYIPRKKIIINNFFENDTDCENELFNVSFCGDDPFYPFGCYNINMDLLKKTPRVMEKRPTYIFTGESGIGKSFLSSRFKDDVKVLETDIYCDLPDKIICDVVVLGNKNKFSLEDVLLRLGDKTEPIICSFEKLNKENL